MGRQLNIRSDEAYELASSLASRQGKSVTSVVEEALAVYAATIETPDETLARWMAMLERNRPLLGKSDFEIEDLYDDETGLPL